MTDDNSLEILYTLNCGLIGPQNQGLKYPQKTFIYQNVDKFFTLWLLNRKIM